MIAEELIIDAESVDLFSIPLFAALVGWKETKVRSKQEKAWTENKEYVKTPQGDILISLKGFKEWARRNMPESPTTEKTSVSPLPTKAKDTDQSSRGNRRRKTTPRPVCYMLK